ncbi:MAG: hypothetical protein ACRD0F_08065, partial [Acidimicrobiales bacterium]
MRWWPARRGADHAGGALPLADEVTTAEGTFLVPRYDEVIRPWVAHYRTWEPGEAALLADLVRPGMTALDVGAHVGLHTVLL